ncbi:MAG: HlyD family efflux transporter periplasmic adaptor subunit [Pirellulaceae bacterium]
MQNNPTILHDQEPIWTDFPALRLVRTGRFIRLFGKITLVLLVFSIIGMVFVPWRQTAQGVGEVLALDPQERPQEVKSGTKGVVDWVKPDLREGSYVEKGDLLMKLVPIAEQGVALIDSQLDAIRAQITNAESARLLAEQAEVLQLSMGESMIRALENDRQVAFQKWEQTKNEVLALQAELDDKRNKLRIAEQVATRGIISQEELFSKQQDAAAASNKVLKAEAAVEEAYNALSSKENEIEAKKQDIYIKNRAAEQKVLEEIQKIRSLEQKLAEARVKSDEQNRLNIKAPKTGYIQQWNGLEGSDTVSEGTQLFVIVPDTTRLAVEMKVSGNDMPLIHEGDPVRLQFEGWPAVQFVGWPSVAIGTFGGKVNRVFPTDDGKGFFRVVVVPDKHFESEKDWPDDRYLRQGVRANGWVLLNQVPLGYEIWRQVNGFPPVITDSEPKEKDEKGGKVKLPKP